MARPTKWNEEKCIALAADMRKFFRDALKKFETDPSYRDIPFISKFCREVGQLTQETLNVKAKEFEELSDALKECKEIQKEILILGGLQSRFHPTAFIFTAKNITDMRDKTQQELSGPDGAALKVNVITYGSTDPILKAIAAPSTYADVPAPVDSSPSSDVVHAESSPLQGGGVASQGVEDVDVRERASEVGGDSDGDLLVRRALLESSKEDRVGGSTDAPEVLST